MFESLTIVGGTPMVQLGNPWGFNQPLAIPLSQLASAAFVEVDIGQFVDSNLIAGGPGNDTVTLSSPRPATPCRSRRGRRHADPGNGTNSPTVSSVETIVGGTGDDTIVLAPPPPGHPSTCRRQRQADFRQLRQFGDRRQFETVIGGSATTRDAHQRTDRRHAGGPGLRQQQAYACGGGTGTVSNANTLVGGAGAT